MQKFIVIQIEQSRWFFICEEAMHDPNADHTYTGEKKKVAFYKS